VAEPFCGTTRRALAGGLYCFRPEHHEGECSPLPDGAARSPVMAPESPVEPRSRSRRVSHRGAKNKGSKGEGEVVKAWRSHGWTDAARSPGSGALRPYPGDVSPWPGDLIGTGPWLVEVKRNERDLLRPARGGGWPGDAFVRGVARELRSLSALHLKTNPLARVRPCLWTRANLQAWTVWVPDEVLDLAMGAAYGPPPAGADLWVGIDAEFFFAYVAGPPETRRSV